MITKYRTHKVGGAHRDSRKFVDNHSSSSSQISDVEKCHKHIIVQIK
jgi:hypothetical protein